MIEELVSKMNDSVIFKRYDKEIIKINVVLVIFFDNFIDGILWKVFFL